MAISANKISQLNNLTFTTERLLIRKLAPQDKAACIAHELDPEMMRYIKDIGTMEEIHARVEESIGPWYGKEGEWLAFAMIEREGDKVIGEVFCRFESIEFQRLEIGFRLNKQFYRQGLMTEALSTFIEQLVLIAEPVKIVGYCVKENDASRLTMEKQGFTLEGVLRKHSTLNGIWHDECVLALVI